MQFVDTSNKQPIKSWCEPIEPGAMKQAQRMLDLYAERKRLEDAGILHSIRGRGDLDEAAGAYKDIGQVMRGQRDLVEILVELSPLAVIKG
ncbi:MAG: hypothetical protein GF331_00030 [Chitinivibrionales bacterium]|nr:hypothetical protein [Chitinivibrionales bacterium]